MVAFVQQGKEQSGEGCNTGRQHHAVLAALQRGNALLQIFLVGATVAGVEISSCAGPIHVRWIIRQGIAVSHGNRPLDGTTVPVNLVADMNGAGGEFVFRSLHFFFHP